MLQKADSAPGFRLLPDSEAELGESPVWDSQNTCFWWVDIDGKKVMRTSWLGFKTHCWEMPECCGFVVLTSAGMPAVGMQTGIYLLDPDSRSLSRLVELDRPGVRFNDATVDESGRLWAGTMDMEVKPSCGVLYTIGSDMQAIPVITGMHVPNGLATDGARRRLYLSDSGVAVSKVWSFDLDPDSGRLKNRREFADFANRPGRPDGAAVDRDGNYWIAAVTGASLCVFSHDGTLGREIPTPFPDPTKPAFGGPALDWLFVTSRKQGANGGRAAVAAPGVYSFRGRPANAWRITS